MTIEEVRRYVANGEGQYVEFKLRVPEPSRFAKEVVAFANSNGGRVFIGVDDDGTIVGVKDSAEEEFALTEALNLYCRPLMRWSSERVPVSSKRDIIVVKVPKSLNKPHYIVVNTEDGSGPAYVRVEDMSLEASPESIKLMQAENLSDGVKFEFGEKELLLMRYLEQYSKVSVAGFAQLASLSTEETGHLLVTLTRAGVIDQYREARGEYYMMAFKE
jgi:predicted HTH transcriptional regulator